MVLNSLRPAATSSGLSEAAVASGFSKGGGGNFDASGRASPAASLPGGAPSPFAAACKAGVKQENHT